ncbi:hypothetical protein X925_03720 [Petrotoga sp. 9T1HF07.CasAA.8.2]|uniref:hypothetical protein n=1 Tax=Petrotoga sp. 9T1HF07.CasAA.8.2 TaxID=1434329 RepID=UPI000CC775F3|nr:hypothetical protein [Petrotoga sp. 9T1HF07.CasAA.8.2]PNR89338.1 hypothetical protein X925_03720 [Petrotoga sp. 9T1HF07.CasAA.8.2]
MKKVLLSLLVVFASFALFAVEPVYDVSGTAGFEFKMDEGALDIQQVLKPKLSIDVKFTETLPATLTAGFTFSPVTVTTESTEVTTTAGATDTDVLTSVVVKPGLSLSYVQYEEEAWLLRFQPSVIALSDYTISGFTKAVGSLKLGLTDYGVNVVLADTVAGEVTEHATGDFAIPGNMILGASYDLDVSGVKGLVAGAFKFEDASNNRVTVEVEVTEVPIPGELSADLAFGLLNFLDASDEASSATAYRVDAAYKYPYKMDTLTVTPHVGFTWQNNLGTVYAKEAENFTSSSYFSVADKQEITAGADLSYLATPITVELTDTFTIDMLEEDPVYLLDLMAAVDYAISDKSSAGVEVPVSFEDLTNEGTITVEPHGYVEYVVPDTKVTLAADVYYFFDNKDESDDNKLAYMGEVSYKYNDYVSAGAHLGNEELNLAGKVIGADPLTDLHWYLYLKAEFKF